MRFNQRNIRGTLCSDSDLPINLSLSVNIIPFPVYSGFPVVIASNSKARSVPQEKKIACVMMIYATNGYARSI